MKSLTLFIGALVLASHSLTAWSADYVAHEWGTFTSVQGADGTQMAWNPFRIAELPRFVYDMNRVSPGQRPIIASKTAFAMKQRMETPVIYFHSDSALTVSAEVTFPQGIVTEWFPTADRPARPKAGLPAITWPKVAIVPRAADEAKGMTEKLLHEAAGSHYYAAREAEADFVQVETDGKPAETEKFLFYRGIGNFDAPLRVTVPDPTNATLQLENTGAEALQDLFILRVGEGLMSIDRLQRLDPAGQATIPSGSPLAFHEGRSRLIDELQAALTRAGLTKTEAYAMVKTWDDSWIAERGVRVLYVLSQSWADKVLPLKLSPAPREIVRVFVGRAEVITPAVEVALIREIDRGMSEDAEVRREAARGIRNLGLGRFLEPAFRRVASQRPSDRNFSRLAWELMQAANEGEPLITRR